jgi:hypothetical protein
VLASGRNLELKNKPGAPSIAKALSENKIVDMVARVNQQLGTSSSKSRRIRLRQMSPQLLADRVLAFQSNVKTLIERTPTVSTLTALIHKTAVLYKTTLNPSPFSPFSTELTKITMNTARTGQRTQPN